MRKKTTPTPTKTPRKKKETTSNMPSLSSFSEETQSFDEAVQQAINDRELKRSVDRWLKENDKLLGEQEIKTRDLVSVTSVLSEYFDSYIMFGYDIENQRIILQNYKTAKDKDAMMEFLRIVFDKYQNIYGEDE